MGGATLSTLNGRKLWESEFHRLYLAEYFTNADQHIGDARKMYLEFEQQNESMRYVGRRFNLLKIIMNL